MMKKTIVLILLTLLNVAHIMSQDNEHLPIVREGVKWVNEKVIVNHGDTTCYYYNYEFSGKDSTLTNLQGDVNNALYYYTSDKLNADTDSLIAGLLSNDVVVTCFRNDSYRKLLLNDGLMFNLAMFTDGGTILLYVFNPSDYPGKNIVSYYLMCQESYEGDHILTDENYYEIEPIVIDGKTCRRAAFINAQGEPLAYVVEGIGFDSRDMGDLLTPFTRRPDPDADYQEWCGLSHVVKDGQIIYKGMRYRHGAFTGINEVVSERSQCQPDPHYYDLMGHTVGTEVPTTPGIYIHQGKKIVVR